MDGSQKLPQRMLDSIRWHLADGGDFPLLAMGVAGWMRYVSGVDDLGQAIEISDPMLPMITQTVQNSEDGEERVRALLGIEAIFGFEPAQRRAVSSTRWFALIYRCKRTAQKLP